jgi:hypothetical protein
MSKNHRQPAVASTKQTKHEQEMSILRAHHERVLKDGALRAATLVGAGVFVRAPDGKIVVAKQYDQVIVPKRAA